MDMIAEREAKRMLKDREQKEIEMNRKL